MKIIVLQENLKQALAHIRRVIPSKPQLPILSSILVEASNDGITFSGTDLYTGMRVRVKGSIENPGTVAVPAQVLTETVTSLFAGSVTLEEHSGSLELTTDQTTAKIQCYASDEYPAFPEKEGQEMTVGWAAFEHILKTVPFSTAKDDSRPVLTSVLFDFNDSVQVVGTDGFRLSHVSLADTALQGKPMDTVSQLLIPAKALQEVHRIASREKNISNISWTFSEQMKQVFFAVEDIEMVIRLMDGEFPPYQKIMPETFETELSLDAEQFETHLKGALVFAKEASQIVTFSFESETLTLTASSPSLGSHQSQMPIQLKTGQPETIAFNAHYILEMLQATKPETVTFKMNQSLQPAMFQVDQDASFKYIVMPFRVTQ